MLTSALEFGSAPASALGSVLKIGEGLQTEEFGLKVLPSVTKLFTSNDRAIRINLLQNLESYKEHLSNQVCEVWINKSYTIDQGSVEDIPVL